MARWGLGLAGGRFWVLVGLVGVWSVGWTGGGVGWVGFGSGGVWSGGFWSGRWLVGVWSVGFDRVGFGRWGGWGERLVG